MSPYLSPDQLRSLEVTLRFAAASGVWLVSEPTQGSAGVARPGGLESVRAALGECRRCRLGEGRTNLVFGVGSARAELFLVGEAPGEEEDRRGEPFVGRAGRLLDRMLRAIGLDRDRVYIANVVKCRPPGNREPSEDEATQCLPVLWRQIEAVGPKLVCALGAHASRGLLGVPGSLASVRGRLHEVRGRRVYPTFHPAYLLRNPGAKRLAWEDWRRIAALLRPTTPASAS